MLAPINGAERLTPTEIALSNSIAAAKRQGAKTPAEIVRRIMMGLAIRGYVVVPVMLPEDVEAAFTEARLTAIDPKVGKLRSVTLGAMEGVRTMARETAAEIVEGFEGQAGVTLGDIARAVRGGDA